MSEHNLRELIKLVDQLDEQAEDYLKQLKGRVSTLSELSMKILCYFTYSLNISHISNSDNIMLCSYNIINLGNKPIHNPYICLSIPNDQGFSLSGKIIQSDKSKYKNQTDAWEQFTQTDNDKEQWLRPVNQEIIPPNETLKFSNFQLKWSATKPYSANIMGYFYCDEFPKGVSAINGISINGDIERGEDIGS